MADADIEIARRANMKPIMEIGAKLGICPDDLIPYGHHKAKINLKWLSALDQPADGKLVLVTAMTPTPAGEGKTTTTVGLGDALQRIGKKTAICLREPSLGPCFGMKGGAAGGGYAQVVPMEDINLQFTGDIPAIGAANNLLAAMIDNHIHWNNDIRIDLRRIAWRRVMDMNDRSLRDLVGGLGGAGNGFPRQSSFDITVASEVMAIVCLSQSIGELQERLGNIIIGETRKRKPVRASDLKAAGAMAVLLRDAIMPNLVQTLENTPALIHGGPFANIAHGCNSVIATEAALKLADFVVTEAGFGADLGAEKFFNIKCRSAGLKPAAAVIVATSRALKWHGKVDKGSLNQENVEAITLGFANLRRHIRNLKTFGVPAVVAINRFTSDTDSEVETIKQLVQDVGCDAVECTHWANGSEGTTELAERVSALAQSGAAQFAPLYDDEMPLWDKAKTIATRLYGADDIIADKDVRTRFKKLQEEFGHLPICMAKTQYSFSTDPNLLGAPSGHVVPIRDVRLSAGAGFVVVLCGQIMTMPGLPKHPAAENIGFDEQGQVVGLF